MTGPGGGARPEVLRNPSFGTARSTVPDNFGTDQDLPWQMTNQRDDTGTINFSTLGTLAMTSLTVSDQAGRVLGTIFNPRTDTDKVWRVDSRIFDEVRMDMAGADVMTGARGAVRSQLADLCSNDVLSGGGAHDLLPVGTGSHTLNGDAG